MSGIIFIGGVFMKKKMRILIMLSFLFIFVSGLTYAISNSFINGIMGVKYSIDRECDESIDVPVKRLVCTGGYEYPEPYLDSKCMAICTGSCGFLPSLAAKAACIALCHGACLVRPPKICKKYELIIIYPCGH